MRIGIDIGNVIIGGGGDDTQFFGPDFMGTPEITGAWSSINAMVMMDHEVHLVSKCGPIVEEKSMKWLEAQYYLNRVPAHRIHFVRKRPLKVYMALALELDIFIDDREDIIGAMKGTVEHPILFTSWKETTKELGRIFNVEA